MDNSEWKDRLTKELSEAINLELCAFYYYLNCASACEKRGLRNIAKFFYEESTEEIGHAKLIIEYMNRLDLCISFPPIGVETATEFSVEKMFNGAYKFEKIVLDNFVRINKLSDEAGDFATSEFVGGFIKRQVKEVKDFFDQFQSSKISKDETGTFIFDQSFRT